MPAAVDMAAGVVLDLTDAVVAMPVTVRQVNRWKNMDQKSKSVT